MKKLILLLAVVAGYVLGTRAGRERYDEIVDGVSGLWGDPRVQDAAGPARGSVRDR